MVRVPYKSKQEIEDFLWGQGYNRDWSRKIVGAMLSTKEITMVDPGKPYTIRLVR